MTAPVAMGVAEAIGGVPALAAVFAVITGMVGALSAKYLFTWMGLDTARAIGAFAVSRSVQRPTASAQPEPCK